MDGVINPPMVVDNILRMVWRTDFENVLQKCSHAVVGTVYNVPRTERHLSLIAKGMSEPWKTDGEWHPIRHL